VLTFAEILSHFDPAKKTGRNYRTRCPAHPDATPSLDIAEGSDVPLFICRSAGCTTADILRTAGLTWNDVLPPRTNGTPLEQVYDYRDATGVLRYQVVRTLSPKGFRQRQPDGAGGYLWKMTGVERLPYRLPELAGHARVFLCEGEKDADRLWTLGLPATCNTGGAKKWGGSESLALKALGVQRVILLQDFDADGAAHVAVAAQHLAGAGITSLTLPPFPGPPKSDISDWLDAGHTVEELDALILAVPRPVPVDALDPAFLADGPVVAQEGQRIAAEGVRYVVDGMIPAYGTLGLLVAYAKVGKTTFAQGLAAAVAMGQPFLERDTVAARVLLIAAEDPPEYTAYLARTLVLDPDRLTFYRAPIQLDADGLRRIVGTVTAGHYGLVLIASWQAVVSTLVKDENDNAGAVRVVEQVKAATRVTGVPWLADAHAGKNEDQADGADPSRAMRGASALAAAADYALWLRYAKGAFASTRKLSGKGRFVDFTELTVDYDRTSGALTVVGDTQSLAAESNWKLICETGALSSTPRSASAIAYAAGLVPAGTKATNTHRRLVRQALRGRPSVGQHDAVIKGWKTVCYVRLESAEDSSSEDR
jgi:hypothetical protein